jgi:hypothetical protein
VNEGDNHNQDHTDGHTPSLAPDDTAGEGSQRTSGGVTARTLVVAGVLVVVLAFLAGYIGSRMGSTSAPEPAPTVTVSASPEPSPTESDSPEPEESVEPEPPVVLPAGADVRAGIGVPDSAHGKEGDVFIDLASADVYVRGADGWRRAGNIRTSAVENLTGEQGESGEQGKPGEPGSSGEPGQPGRDGTQVVLGTGSPDSACDNEGDVFVDTAEVRFYSCTDGTWAAAS